MMVRMHVNMHDLMMIAHALQSYKKRPGASEKELREEGNLLDRVNDNIRILRRMKDGKKEQQ